MPSCKNPREGAEILRFAQNDSFHRVTLSVAKGLRAPESNGLFCNEALADYLEVMSKAVFQSGICWQVAVGNVCTSGQAAEGSR